MQIPTYTPKKIVAELDRYIVGQHEAKKAVSIALRNRWRRAQLPDRMREEIVPKNILMIGPTGCGKTEIARRLARLSQAPFLKVEATKFTEVGYVGRDVESIIRDLVEASLVMLRDVKRRNVVEKAKDAANQRIVTALVGDGATAETRNKFLQMLVNGDLEDKEIDIKVADISSPVNQMDIPGMPSAQIINFTDMMKGFMNRSEKSRRMTVAKAREALIREESDKLLDNDALVQEAIQRAQNHGIVFLDEIDKVCARSYEGSGGRGGADISREGVQRDLLPLIEGTTVSTKYGLVKTDHILFIASGAFHLAKPSDLLPELQGRLPIRVELSALTCEDMRRILTEPEQSLLKQYIALMETEKVKLQFTDDAIDSIAQLATDINERVENIGARRLATVMEKLLEEVSFTASERSGEEIQITAKDVTEKVASLASKSDLSRFIL
ncbi:MULTISPECIES: ATP-dependent protease ATPase subunit HslU [Commensalibacter]|uniref:ATP-dependent protease ATPase subunit HslU n=1 Tax=Commensalibacter TaxID=1079922 RepID=UPI000EFBA11F|nr:MULTISPECIES: ATP-dependent protease ATPase subunit HslU [Commensalibacter]AYN87177.1 ATP-dependent protease ATPase subunit HslU [Commensalibacter melissae]MBH9969272.1 ATP-dependent protease ATPase subunit HslU [Commensalibacter sp. M0265]MBH9973159.1 ATP-dependent protease ATPase subunit HslU [Commensalibacter melissae]MBH9976627.1 ATP-dependent protease ATPase subunit HslU [Commensalibacter sp. M0266]MBH9992436.1 ATP-dependent protease ATPase subunit HslU [Commensalibacter sp. M0270]